MLREADTTRSLIKRMRKRQAIFFGYEMRREKLEHLVKNEMIEGKCSRRKQHEKKLDGLTKWLKVGRVTALKETRDSYTWKVMIAYPKEHGT